MDSEDIIIDNYRIISGLGSGAFGLVYKVQHIIFTDRTAALKLLRLDYLEDREACLRFLADAQLLNQLQHKYILPIIHAGLYQGVPFQITEYASKGSLRDRLLQQSAKPMQIAEVITILTQIGQGLQFAHEQNIIHRDLKPENILFNERGDALIADFGIATILNAGSAKHTNAIGTLEYMAPEEFQDITAKESDQYALGCIAYELLTGRKPFEASNPAAIIAKHLSESPIPPRFYNPELPENIEQAILKALAKPRTARHKDVTAFISELVRAGSNYSQTSSQDSNSRISHKTIPNSQTYSSQEIDSSSSKQSVTSLINQGLMLKDAGRYNEALTLFEKALSLDENNNMIWAYMRDVFQSLGRHEEALHAQTRANNLKKMKVLENFEEVNDEDYDEFEEDLGTDPTFRGAYEDQSDQSAFPPSINREPEYLFEDRLTFNKLAAIPKGGNEAKTNVAEILFERSLELARQEQFHAALNNIESALKQKRDFVSAWFFKGMLLYILSRFEEALEAYQNTIMLDPEYVSAYLCRGEIFLQRKNFNEALSELFRAIQVDPNNLIAWTYLGDALLELNQLDQALAAYEKALTLDKTSASIYFGMGRVYRKQGRYKEALEAYQIADILSPNSPDIYHNRGNVLLDLKLYSEALNSFEQEIRLLPSADAFICKGNALRGLKRFQEALEALEYAINLAPDFLLAYINKGNVLLELERYEEALASYNQASFINPHNAHTHFGKSRALLFLGRNEEALAEIQKCTHLNSEHADTYFVQGIIFKALARFNEALISLNRAITLLPAEASFYELKGEILFDLKQYAEAVTAYSLSIKLDHLNAYTYYKMGCALFELRELKEALTAFDFATKVAPDFVLAHLQKGFALFEQGKYEDALNAFRFVIRLDNTIAAAYLGESMALSNLRDYKKAIKSIEIAIRLNPNSASLWNFKGTILTNLNRHKEAQKAFGYARYLEPNGFFYNQ
jgi:tetratricopeptide (TPR) repeat protein